MKRYWRCLTYPLFGPPFGAFVFILAHFVYECATTDRCFIGFVFLPEIVVGIFGIAYLYGAAPAFVAGLVVSILRSVWPVTSMLAVFVIGLGAGTISLLVLIPPVRYWNLTTALPDPWLVAFLVIAGIAALAAEWVSRRILRRADARTEDAKA